MYSKNINRYICICTYLKKKYKNTWVLMYRSIKQFFFFTQVHKTTVRDSFDWITLEQY